MSRLLAVAAACLITALPAGDAVAASLAWGPPAEIDRLQPFGAAGGVNGLSCVGTAMCVGVDSAGYAVVSTNPAADAPVWSIPRPVASSPWASDVSCPSTTLCAAVGAGSIAVTTNPTAAAPVWKEKVYLDQPAAMLAVSCPSTGFCAAVDLQGTVHVSTDPSAATPTWTRSGALFDPLKITDISCASDALCVIVGNDGNVRRSTDPAAASPTWSSAADVGGDQALQSVDCPTTAFCAAVTDNGFVHRTTDPTAATPTWTPLDTGFPVALRGIDCPTVTGCTAVGSGSRALTTTDAAATTPVWRSRTLQAGGSLGAVSCGTADFCITTSPSSASLSSVTRDASSPSPSPTWSGAFQIAGVNALGAATCRSETLCLVADSRGRVLRTLDPTAVAPAWKLILTPALAIRAVAVACPGASLCVLAQRNGRVWVTHDPAVDAPTWAPVPPTSQIADMACPSTDKCIAVHPGGSVSVLTHLSRIGNIDNPGPEWADPTMIDGPAGTMSTIDCPTETHCAVGSESGGVYMTATATAADPAWVTGPNWIIPHLDMSCPTTGLCVLTDLAMNVYTSSSPFGLTPVWKDPVGNIGERVHCPVETLCVAGGTEGSVRLSENPAAATPAWSPAIFPGAETGLASSVACAGDRLCLLADHEGRATFGVAAPQNGGAPSVTGEAVAGRTLTATGGTWTGAPATTLQWERCDGAGGGCAAVDGATGATYAVTAGDVGATLRVTETATNAGGSRTSSSAVTSVVPPLPVVAPPPVVTAPQPTLEQILQALFAQSFATAGFSPSFTAPVAGKLVVRWFSRTRRKVLLAKGSRAYTAAGAGKVKMKLTKKGKRILRKGRKVKITLKATFTPAGGKPVSFSRRTTVKR